MRPLSWAPALVVGCSLVTNTGELVGEGAPRSDGGTATTDGSPSDASALPDGGPALEGGADVTSLSDASDAPAPVGCSGRTASFCADFDGLDPLGSGTWTSSSPGPGSITLTQTTPVSIPNAARFEVTNGTCAFVNLNRRFSGPVTRATAHAKVRFGSLASPLVWSMQPTAAVTYVVAGFHESSNDIAVYTQRADGSGNADLTNASQAITPLSPGTFYDVELSMQTAPTRSVSFRIGSTTTSAALPAEIELNNPQLHVGHWCVQGTRSVDFDDVWVTLE